MKRFILTLLLGTSGYASAEYGCDHHWRMFEKLRDEAEIGRLAALMVAGATSIICPPCTVLILASGGMAGAISYKILDEQADEHFEKYKNCMYAGKCKKLAELNKDSDEAKILAEDIKRREEEHQREENEKALREMDFVLNKGGVTGNKQDTEFLKDPVPDLRSIRRGLGF